MTILYSIPQVEQLSKLSSFQSDKYVVSERPGDHPEETISNLASAGKCFGDFVVGIVAHARINFCLPEYDLLFTIFLRKSYK